MYKEMEYKTYKEHLFKGIRLDVMNLTEILSKNSNQNMVTNPTNIFPVEIFPILHCDMDATYSHCVPMNFSAVYRLVNETCAIAIVQAGMLANQFASTIDHTCNITIFTENCTDKSFFFSEDSKKTCP